MAIDARTLTAPIVCTLEEIVETTQRTRTKAIEALRQVAERNDTSHQRGVSALVRATGNSRAMKVNEARNGGR